MSRRNSLIDISTITAEGPGLKGGKLGEECKFKLKGTDGGLALSFHIEGPSKPMFETMAGKDCLEVSYVPLVPGDYKLCLMWYGKHIEGSPFHFTIEGVGPPPTLEELVQKIKISGKGLEFARSQEYNEIYIDCRRVYLKDHKLKCSIKAPPRSSAMVKLEDNKNGTYTVLFKPTFAGNYQISIKVDDVHAPGSPFPVHVRS